MTDRWAKTAAFFTTVGAIAAVLVVPDFRKLVGLPPLPEAHQVVNGPIQSPAVQPNRLVDGAAQAHPNNDVSDTYGNVNGTIFNKKTHVVFATPEEFFKDSGRNSFVGLIFDNVPRLPDDAVMVNGRRVAPTQSRGNGKGGR
jgi:hypothetical protein